MLPLPEVGELGGVIIIDGVHAPVLQPVRHGHPSPLHLHGVYPGVPAELQDHLAGYRLAPSERRIGGTVQLQLERLYGAQHCCYVNQKYSE